METGGGPGIAAGGAERSFNPAETEASSASLTVTPNAAASDLEGNQIDIDEGNTRLGLRSPSSIVGGHASTADRGQNPLQSERRLPTVGHDFRLGWS